MSTSQEIMEETEDHTQEDETEAQQLREEEDEEEFELDREAEADKEDEDNDEENPAGGSQTAAESESSRKKRKKDTNVRRPGELILPFSRVQRVIKADKVRYSARLTQKLISCIGYTHDCKRCHFLDWPCDRVLHSRVGGGCT